MTVEQIVAICGVITAMGGAIGVIAQWIVKPLKKWWSEQMSVLEKQDQKLEAEFENINLKLESIEETLSITNDDVADVLGDRLMQAHRHFMNVGWMPPAEKKRFVDLHKRYSKRGHNHLADSYETDLLALPEEPPKKG